MQMHDLINHMPLLINACIYYNEQDGNKIVIVNVKYQICTNEEAEDIDLRRQTLDFPYLFSIDIHWRILQPVEENLHYQYNIMACLEFSILYVMLVLKQNHLHLCCIDHIQLHDTARKIK